MIKKCDPDQQKLKNINQFIVIKFFLILKNHIGFYP